MIWQIEYDYSAKGQILQYCYEPRKRQILDGDELMGMRNFTPTENLSCPARPDGRIGRLPVNRTRPGSAAREDLKPDVNHLIAGGPLPELRTGSVVMAKKDTDACRTGEVGVVYQEYRLGDRAHWGVIFENGCHDGFNAPAVERYLTVSGEVCEPLAGYAFVNVRRLAEDFELGVFAPVFSGRARRPATAPF